MRFCAICPDPTTYHFTHKHNQIKNLQKLLLDTKQTDIKMLRFSFFLCFFQVAIVQSTKIKHGHLYWNMYGNVYKLLLIQTPIQSELSMSSIFFPEQ